MSSTEACSAKSTSAAASVDNGKSNRGNAARESSAPFATTEPMAPVTIVENRVQASSPQ